VKGIPHSIGIEIRNITFNNRRFKFRKAMGELAKNLDLPIQVMKAGPRKVHAQESYLYQVQQQLSDQWVSFYSNILKNIYGVLTTSLGIPLIGVETMGKALNDGVLRYKGRVLYKPESGEPIQKKEFEALIKAIENYLNRNTKGAGDKIILDSVAIGKILRRMGKYQTTKEMEGLTLDTLKYRGRTFDWISDSVKNIHNALGEELPRYEQARYQVAQDWVGHRITRLTNELRDDVKDVILTGIRERRGKAQVSQDLFNKMGKLNRDWKRIADTEMVNTSNLAGIMEEVNQTPEGEKVYFKRYELPGCCDKCERINGMVVLWSPVPLDTDKIKDKYAKVAIWEGKAQDKNSIVTGTMHPNCRGGFARWFGKYADAIIAHVQNKTQLWDKSVSMARAEYKEKGIENPTDQTPGYLDRINEIYKNETT
jgi:hypothetical protein